MATEREKLLNNVNGRLWGYAGHVKAAQGKLSDGAEELFRGLLDRMLGCKLRNMNREKKNFPGIDLGDDSEGVKLCVQVTSDGSRDKVRHTLKEFFEEKLHERFGRLIVLVVGNAQKFTGEPEVKYGFDFQTKRDIWDTARLVQEIEALDDDRLESVAEFLKDQLQDYRWEAPEKAPLDLPLRTAMNERNFVGRERELAEIAKRFETERVVVLSGLGGMGKTELAVRFAQLYDRGAVYFAGFRRDFFHTVTDEIALGIEGLTEQKLDEEAKFKAAMAVLRKCGKDDLMILDNADTEEASFEQLRREASVLPMRILITTRCDAVGAIDVNALHREELHRIFHQYVPDIDVADMDALIDEVDHHTLTVDLMARSMRPGRRAATPEKMLNALKSRDLTSESFMKVATTYPGGLKQARINEHLRAVFRVAGLSDDEKDLLRCATLLPSGGMDDMLFMAPFAEEKQDVLDGLIQKGWLLWKDELLKIHPVIRIVCREELKPTEENCGVFLVGVWHQYDPKHYDKEKFCQMAELFTLASDDLEDQEGEWALTAGFIWLNLGEARRALDCELQMVEKREQNWPGSNALATAYNNLGNTYGKLGDNKKALEYLLKALAIREKVLPPEHRDLATSYNNVGCTYDDLGDYERALKYKLKALVNREKMLLPDHLERAIYYDSVGVTYGHLGHHHKALEYGLKALTIKERMLSPDHPDLAKSYNNVGTAYGALGDNLKALEYKLKDLYICEKILPPDHPDLATSYNNIGITYDDLGDPQKALEYKLKAMAIREKVLPPGHPDLATSYNNIGYTYVVLGDPKKALEYQKKALTIQEKVLPKDHPHNVSGYGNISVTYAQLNDFASASAYAEKALERAERSMQGTSQLEWCRQLAQTMRHLAEMQAQGIPFKITFK